MKITSEQAKIEEYCTLICRNIYTVWEVTKETGVEILLRTHFGYK